MLNVCPGCRPDKLECGWFAGKACHDPSTQIEECGSRLPHMPHGTEPGPKRRAAARTRYMQRGPGLSCCAPALTALTRCSCTCMRELLGGGEGQGRSSFKHWLRRCWAQGGSQARLELRPPASHWNACARRTRPCSAATAWHNQLIGPMSEEKGVDFRPLLSRNAFPRATSPPVVHVVAPPAGLQLAGAGPEPASRCERPSCLTGFAKQSSSQEFGVSKPNVGKWGGSSWEAVPFDCMVGFIASVSCDEAMQLKAQVGPTITREFARDVDAERHRRWRPLLGAWPSTQQGTRRLARMNTSSARQRRVRWRQRMAARPGAAQLLRQV